MRKVIRYKKVNGSRQEKIKQFNQQLDKFEKDAQSGKLVCLSDLIGNAENIHLS